LRIFVFSLAGCILTGKLVLKTPLPHIQLPFLLYHYVSVSLNSLLLLVVVVVESS
jgi:hypothetical protein